MSEKEIELGDVVVWRNSERGEAELNVSYFLTDVSFRPTGEFGKPIAPCVKRFFDPIESVVWWTMNEKLRDGLTSSLSGRRRVRLLKVFAYRRLRGLGVYRISKRVGYPVSTIERDLVELSLVLTDVVRLKLIGYLTQIQNAVSPVIENQTKENQNDSH